MFISIYIYSTIYSHVYVYTLPIQMEKGGPDDFP